MIALALLVAIGVFAYLFINGKNKKSTAIQEPVAVDPALLEQNVLFYARLNSVEKLQFENDVKEFLQRVKITGVDVKIAILDKLLVAAAAVIPIFYFKDWKYYNLQEVLLYSDSINMDFESTGSEGRNIMGMVGTGSFEGKMLLSKHALYLGFDNKTDKNNTAIHEFVHLLDKSDGETDGVPELLLDKQYVIPWINLMHEKMKEIEKGKSGINPYALMNKAEFFAVTAEYFFERPTLLKDKHPGLYKMLEEMFDKK